MAACHRVWHRFRRAQLLFRTNKLAAVDLMQRPSEFGNHILAANKKVESLSCPQSTAILQVQGWSLSRDSRWTLRRNVALRSVHEVASVEDPDREEKEKSYRRGGVLGVFGGKVEGVSNRIAPVDIRNLVQHVHLASIRKKLRNDPRDTISYEELLHIIQSARIFSNNEEAVHMAQVFNQAGVVLTFRDKVHLHPEKIAELVASVLPPSLRGEDNPRSKELIALLKEKREIDRKAHKQMRLVLWTGLGGIVVKLLLFVRLTFWELSWDIMEPIAFFTSASGIVCGYTYFMVTSSSPSYQDFMQRIFQSRQQKLFRKQTFDIKRFEELQMRCEAKLHPLPRKALQDTH